MANHWIRPRLHLRHWFLLGTLPLVPTKTHIYQQYDFVTTMLLFFAVKIMNAYYKIAPPPPLAYPSLRKISTLQPNFVGSNVVYCSSY